MHISTSDRNRCYHILSIRLSAIHAWYQLVLLGTHLLRTDRNRDDLWQEPHIDCEDELSMGACALLQCLLHRPDRATVLD